MSDDGLTRILVERIRAHGPIGVDGFMAAALGDPTHGYYRTRDPLGRGGDFITAPEISQIFGEMIGAWCANIWQEMGEPKPCHLAEFGPGRGTLMADALRAFKLLPRAGSALRIHLVETSPVLRRAQAATLAKHHPHVRPKWHNSLETLPDGPCLYIGNEFFDALPIKQWVRQGGAWIERRVGLDADDRFVFADGAPGTPPVEPPTAGEGAIFETCAPALEIASAIGRRLAVWGGAALFIDYGHGRTSCSETLQAIRAHKYAPVLEDPGLSDLTAHVDFEALGNAFSAGGAKVYGPVTQGAFLMGLGADIRAGMLSRGRSEAQMAQIMAGLDRLVNPRKMGSLFKVLEIR